MRFLDGTFKSAPTIFFQLFAILGSITQRDKTLALPFVHALFQKKEQASYQKNVDIVLFKSRDYWAEMNFPSAVMSDFGVGVINAVENSIGEDRIR